jgi:ribosomal protein S18 acetylase RimI-like enzyme
MIDLLKDCEFVELSRDHLINAFNCNDNDLNDFFNRDAILFQEQLLGKTFFFRLNETEKVVAAFSLSADSIKTWLLPSGRRGKVKQLIPHEKSLQSYPAFLIGRLGVSVEFSGQGIGSQLLEVIVDISTAHYSNVARFLTVDAYNSPGVLNYYRKNEFDFLFTTEEQERENLKKSVAKTEILRTRQMFFDLKRVNNG